MTSVFYHRPVLLHQSLDGLDIKKTGIYVDATFGGGGHSLGILERLGPEGRLIAFDRDPAAANNVPEDSRFQLIPENYSTLTESLKHSGVMKVNGILADLGVSSHQFDTPERGFSFRFKDKLDMRMEQSGDLDASVVLNTYSYDALKHMFKTLGELKKPGLVAKKIVEWRSNSEFVLSSDLENALSSCYSQKDKAGFLAQVFQALRIEVNDELNALDSFLNQASGVLQTEGRMVVISYHSLEDRKVKNLFRTGNTEGIEHKDFFGNKINPWNSLTRKPVIPEEEEIKENSRARSAKMRVAELK